MNGYNKNAALRADCYKKIVPTFVSNKLVQNILKYTTERIGRQIAESSVHTLGEFIIRKDTKNYVQKN